MVFDNARASATQELIDAMTDAKARGDRFGASEYGPGPSRNRDDVAPMVNRDHRRSSTPPPVEVTSARPHAGRPRPRLAD